MILYPIRKFASIYLVSQWAKIDIIAFVSYV